MSIQIKVWDQGHDGHTIALRVADSNELSNLAVSCTEPDLDKNYLDLSDFLQQADNTSNSPIIPYKRLVDVIWLTNLGYGSFQFFPNRIFEVTYTGIERASGGFSSQGYIVHDPEGFDSLEDHVGEVLNCDYLTSSMGRDVIIVRS